MFSNILHLLVVVVVQLIICRFLLPQTNVEVLPHTVLLDTVYYLLLLECLLACFCESEIGACA